MWSIGKVRFSMATLMIFVLTAAMASALFAEVRQHLPASLSRTVKDASWTTDIPALLILAIGLTGIALGAWKGHSAVQMMLQIGLAYLGCLFLIWLQEAGLERAFRYWFQGMFAATVVLPLLTRRYVKAEMPRGPRRDQWKKTTEAVAFTFLNLLLVGGGAIYQVGLNTLIWELLGG